MHWIKLNIAAILACTCSIVVGAPVLNLLQPEAAVGSSQALDIVRDFLDALGPPIMVNAAAELHPLPTHEASTTREGGLSQWDANKMDTGPATHRYLNPMPLGLEGHLDLDTMINGYTLTHEPMYFIEMPRQIARTAPLTGPMHLHVSSVAQQQLPDAVLSNQRSGRTPGPFGLSAHIDGFDSHFTNSPQNGKVVAFDPEHGHAPGSQGMLSTIQQTGLEPDTALEQSLRQGIHSLSRDQIITLFGPSHRGRRKKEDIDPVRERIIASLYKSSIAASSRNKPKITQFRSDAHKRRVMMERLRNWIRYQRIKDDPVLNAKRRADQTKRYKQRKTNRSAKGKSNTQYEE